MKTVLVVGCAGGIGSATCKKLIEQGYKAIGLAVKEECPIESLEYYKVDIRNDQLKKLILRLKNQ